MRSLCLLLVLCLTACQGFQGSIQIGVQFPLRFDSPELSTKVLRVATFNVAMVGKQSGDLRARLSTSDDLQAKNLAAILQQVRPSIVLLNEFDYDPTGELIDLFQQNYLQRSQASQKPITYPHVYLAPSNTGIPSGFDLDRDGRQDGPGDALGYGSYEGQYAFLLLSQYEINESQVRSFQQLLWREMPGALLPDHPQRPDHGDWYSSEELAVLRLSSKNHVDVPVQVQGQTLHLLLSHPTPPVFDGPEDRNGRRNHDEIRLWADYLSAGVKAEYLVDDQGQRGGLDPEALFVVLGDLNADPVDGDSTQHAIRQLLGHPRVHPAVWQDDRVPRSSGGESQRPRTPPHQGSAAEDTATWGLRVDYVLPSRELEILRSGIFWPDQEAPQASWLHPSSDHRLVWLDLKLP